MVWQKYFNTLYQNQEILFLSASSVTVILSLESCTNTETHKDSLFSLFYFLSLPHMAHTFISLSRSLSNPSYLPIQSFPIQHVHTSLHILFVLLCEDLHRCNVLPSYLKKLFHLNT